MINTFIARFFQFLLLLLLQVLIFNHIHILGYATPLIYIYFLILQPSDISRISLLLWGFVMGLCVDLFVNTPGVASGAMTFVGMIRPQLLKMYMPRDYEDVMLPSSQTLGWRRFSLYVITTVVFYVCVFYLLEAFSFFNIYTLLIKIAGSSVLTILMIFAFDGIRHIRK